jgi:hypothetical protein
MLSIFSLGPKGRRDENPVVNPAICTEDAKTLMKAGE